MAKEDKWIEVLSGRSKPNPKNKDEIEASYLREAIGSYEKKIGLDNPNPELSFARFEQLLKEEDEALTKKNSTFNQASFERTKNALESSTLLQKEIGLTKSFFTKQVSYIKTLASIVVGILIGLTPVFQQTVRNASDSLYSNVVSFLKSHSAADDISREIFLEKNEPISESRLITESAISLGMTVIRSEKLEGKEKVQILIIKGFKKFDEKQAEYLKPKLDLEGRDEGNIKFVIRKKK